MTTAETIELTQSLAMQERASIAIPGMTQLLSKRPDQFAPGVWPGYYDKASGVTIWDLDGNKYIDMSIGGIGANVLGYADPDVDTAVISAINKGSSSSLNCVEEVELAELLCDIHLWANKVKFARTGGEAMCVAVRIARAHTGRDKIAFCGYHGWHDWYLAANIGTENALGEHLLTGLDPRGVPRGLAGTALPFRYNKIEEVERIFSECNDEIAAVVMEPQRDCPPEDGFLQAVKEIASKHGSVLIFDEITSAFRINSGGLHLRLGVEPDIAVFSKALGNGYPIAAIIGIDTVMEAAQSTFISSTNWTERIGPTAAIATIKKHQRVDAGSHLEKLGKMVKKGLGEIALSHGLAIHAGGLAPISHFSFDCENSLAVKALFVQLMLDQGFLASTSCYLMYAHTLEHIERYLEAVDRVFAEISTLQSRGEIESALIGPPATAGFKRLT